MAAWISALTGVGPSIASGSHVYRGICADFPVAPRKRSSAIAVAMALPGANFSGATEKTSLKSSVPRVVKSKKIAIANPKSPIRLTIKAFLPASEADFFSNQKPINR